MSIVGPGVVVRAQLCKKKPVGSQKSKAGRQFSRAMDRVRGFVPIPEVIQGEDISISTLTRWRKEGLPRPVLTAVLLARALGTTVEELAAPQLGIPLPPSKPGFIDPACEQRIEELMAAIHPHMTPEGMRIAVRTLTKQAREDR